MKRQSTSPTVISPIPLTSFNSEGAANDKPKDSPSAESPATPSADEADAKEATEDGKPKPRRKRSWSRRVLIVVVALVAVLIAARYLAVDVLSVPEGCGSPCDGKRALVWRWSYGYRLPWDETKRWAYATAKRGQWLVYNHPAEGRLTPCDTCPLLVAQVQAAPGDTLWYNNAMGILSPKRDVKRGTTHALVVPAKGQRVEITPANTRFYLITINLHEPVKASLVGDSLFINGSSARNYTFQNDYYWLSNGSDDAGFIPHRCLVGKIINFEK